MIEYLTEIIIASVFTIPTVAFAWGSWGGGGVSGGGTGGFGAAGTSSSSSSSSSTTTTTATPQTALQKAIAESQAKYPTAWAKATGTTGTAAQAAIVTGTQTQLNLITEIAASQEANPTAWEKATGTTDKAKQLSIVTGNQKRISQQTLTNGINTYHYDGSIATTEQQWLRPEPSPALLDAIAASQAKHPTAWANATGTTDKAKQTASVTGGFTGAPVQITGVEGGEFTFLNQPPMPSGSIISQTEFNTLVQKYGKETADKLATQTYLTREEFKQQYPQFQGSAAETQQIIYSIQEEQERIQNENRVHQTTRTTAPSTTTTAPSTTTAATSSYVYPPTPSSFSFLPFVLVGVVLVGILIIIRRRK